MIYNHGVLFSPYQGFRAPEIGVVTDTELGEPHEPEEISNQDFHGFNRVDKGFHSFKTVEEVKHIVNGYRNDLNLVIFKCIIPRGSSYYEGRFDIYKSYCSNSIKLIEICV